METTIQDRARILKRLCLDERREAAVTAEKLAPLQEQLNVAIADLKTQFEVENFNLLLQHREAMEAADAYEADLRGLVVQHYRDSGLKRLDADCSVRITSRFEYDTAEAVEWAEKNAPILIVKTVDKKAFESLPQAAGLDFVAKTDTVSAVLAKTFTEVN